MKYKLSSPLQFILFSLFTLSLILSMSIMLFDEEQIINVDCYDRFSNKIIGEICEEEVFENQDILDGSIAIFAISLMCFTMVSLNNSFDYNSDSNFFGFEKRSTETK